MPSSNRPTDRQTVFTSMVSCRMGRDARLCPASMPRCHAENGPVIRMMHINWTRISQSDV
jgi:hypothetical protein